MPKDKEKRRKEKEEEMMKRELLNRNNRELAAFKKHAATTGAGGGVGPPPLVPGDQLPATHPGHPDFITPPPTQPIHPITYPTDYNPKYDLIMSSSASTLSRPPPMDDLLADIINETFTPENTPRSNQTPASSFTFTSVLHHSLSHLLPHPHSL